jgi:hypothetical protein
MVKDVGGRMVKNLIPRVIHGQHISPAGSTYPKDGLWVGTLYRFLAGLLQSTRAFAARQAVLTFLRHSSIGDKSGEYGGT